MPAWHLEASSGVLRDAGGETLLFAPRLDIYQKGKKASRVTARTGTLQAGTQDLQLEGDVRVIAHDDKSTLKTEHLVYLAGPRRFHTEDRVVIQRPGAVLKGKGLDASGDLNEIRIHNQESRLQ